VGLSQHSVLLAVAISTSALLIAAVGSWRLAYFILGGALMVQMLAWVVVAREARAPVAGLQRAIQTQLGTPLRAIRTYPQGWLIGVTMFSWSATWTAMVTFLPTFLLEERDVSLKLGGPLLAFLYYVLIPSAPVAAYLERKVKSRKLFLWVPSLFNVIFGLSIAVTANPWLLMAFITGLGMVWIASPVVQVLPFEFPGIRPREVAVIAALVATFSGLGFAAGPLITGLVAQFTDSLQTGLIVLSLLTGVGVIAGLFYPSQLREVEQPVEVPG
jgi:cyanate permease